MWMALLHFPGILLDEAEGLGQQRVMVGIVFFGNLRIGRPRVLREDILQANRCAAVGTFRRKNDVNLFLNYMKLGQFLQVLQ
jgi:hypothetical protein